jgi:hypothetical protein
LLARRVEVGAAEEALVEAVIQRQDVVAAGLSPPQAHQFDQLLDHRVVEVAEAAPGEQIVGLSGILVDVVQLPLLLIDVGEPRAALPGQAPVERDGLPAVLDDPAVAEHLEVLCGSGGRCGGVGEAVVDRDALDRGLLHAVHDLRGLDPGGGKDRWHDVDCVVELVS